MDTYRRRFNLTHPPLPKNAVGKTFFDQAPGYQKLSRRFRQLIDEPGLGVLTAEPGAGKTAAMRHLCGGLPQPDHRVVYLCDTAVSPLDLYRMLAIELGVKPQHRRAGLWADLKKTLIHLVDEQHVRPIVVLDEAQHLSDRFLLDLSGFLNFAFDSRELFTLWLVGLPPLAARLRYQQHAALAMRIAAQVHLEPFAREAFAALIDHGLKAAGATDKLLADPALELLFRTSHGVPRVAARLLRSALRLADERGQGFVDEPTMEAAIEEHLPPAVAR
jgi:type II secretory pathway predicted ATPase ExeA